MRDRPDRPEAEPESALTVAPLVWEGRLPTVTSPPVRIAARRASELAAESTRSAPIPTPHAAPDAA